MAKQGHGQGHASLTPGLAARLGARSQAYAPIPLPWPPRPRAPTWAASEVSKNSMATRPSTDASA